MMETLWTICAWTGFAYWCGVFIAATVIACSAALDAALAKWEDDEIRRIANDDLPANWVEKDVEGSFNDTWSEIRRRRGR